MPSNILSRKGREIAHPLHGKTEKLFVLPDSAWEIDKITAHGRIRIGDLPDVRRRWCACVNQLSYPTQPNLREISVSMTLNL